MTKQLNTPPNQTLIDSKKRKIAKLTKAIKQNSNTTQNQSLSKKEIKMIRNRQHAQKSRDTKQIYILTLQLQIQNLKKQIEELKNKQTHCVSCKLILDQDIPLLDIQNHNQQNKVQSDLDLQQFYVFQRLDQNGGMNMICSIVMICICVAIGSTKIYPLVNNTSNIQKFDGAGYYQSRGQVKTQLLHEHQQLGQFLLSGQQMVAFTSIPTIKTKGPQRALKQGYPKNYIKDIEIQSNTLTGAFSKNINDVPDNIYSKTNQILHQNNNTSYNHDVLFCQQPIIYRYNGLKNDSFTNGKLLLMLAGKQQKQIPMNKQGINLAYQQHENVFQILADISSVKVLNKSLCNGKIK